MSILDKNDISVSANASCAIKEIAVHMGIKLLNVIM